MLEIFIVLNEKDKEKHQGEGSANNSEGKEGGRKSTHFFLKSEIMLGLHPKKRLFKVCSSTLTSK